MSFSCSYLANYSFGSKILLCLTFSHLLNIYIFRLYLSINIWPYVTLTYFFLMSKMVVSLHPLLFLSSPLSSASTFSLLNSYGLLLYLLKTPYPIPTFKKPIFLVQKHSYKTFCKIGLNNTLFACSSNQPQMFSPCPRSSIHLWWVPIQVENSR